MNNFKANLFILAILLIFLQKAHSQQCLSESLTFTTQGQIDSFSLNYPDVTSIEGDVEIGGGLSNSDITNIFGL